MSHPRSPPCAELPLGVDHVPAEAEDRPLLLGREYRALEPTIGRVTASDDRLDRFGAIQNGAPEREHRITTGDASWPRQNKQACSCACNQPTIWRWRTPERRDSRTQTWTLEGAP